MSVTSKHNLTFFSGKIARIAWAAWFSIMLATPYFLLNPYAGARLSSKYAYIAFGLVVGAVLVFCFREKLAKLPESFKASIIILLVFAVAASLFFVLLEWYRMPAYLTGDAEAGFWGPRYRLPSVFEFFPIRGNDLAFIYCGAMCSIAGAWAFCGSSTACLEKSKLQLNATAQISCKREKILSVLPYFIFILLFVVGFSMRAFFSAFFPYCDSHDNFTIKFILPSCFILVPYIYVFFLVLLSGALSEKLHRFLVLNGLPISSMGFYAMLVLSFSLGMLCWNGLCHAYPTYSSGLFNTERLIIALGVCCVVSFALELIALFVMSKLFKHEGNQTILEPGTKDKDEVSFHEFQRCLSAYPESDSLTEREVEALHLMIMGLSSSKAAERLGISASTERQYLSRAYKKLNVANSEEFKTLFFIYCPDFDLTGKTASVESYGADTFRVEQEAILDVPGRDREISSKVEWIKLLARDLISLAGVAFFPIWCFMQKDFSLHLIDARKLMICVSWAMIVWGVWKLFCMMLPELPVRIAELRGHRFLIAAGRILFAVCGIISTVGIWMPDNAIFVLELRTTLLVLFSVFVFTIGCLNSLYQTFFRLKVKIKNLFEVVLVALIPVVILMILASLNQSFSLAVGIIASICSLLYRSDFRFQPEMRVTFEKFAKYDKTTVAIGCGMFAFIGLYADEIASTSVEFNLVDSGIVFFAVFCLSIFAFLFISQTEASKRAMVAIFTLALLAACAICGSYIALPIIFLFLFIGNMVSRQGESIVAFTIYSAFFGLGAIGAFYIVNWTSHALFINYGLLEIHDEWAFENLLRWDYLAVGVILIISILVTVIFLFRVSRELSFKAHMGNLAENMECKDAFLKIRYFLISKGLNETQASVLCCISRGDTISAIAKDLSYSKGTVKSACHVGYRKLNIHSREELISLLNRELSL